MLGMLADPVTGLPLARKPNRPPAPFRHRVSAGVAILPATLSGQDREAAVARIEAAERVKDRSFRRPVAGFDLTFSVPKSISSARAVADEGTKAVIYACHQEAVARTIDYAEAEVFHSRSGSNGVVQEDIKGVAAAGFDHWDSRAGDPQLHTHVVVLNRAQSASDGAWRSLDSRGLFKQVVTLSELHQGILGDLLTESLGWGFDPRQRKYSAVPKYEVTGVSEALMAEFSQRSGQIAATTNALVEQFVSAHGRQPTTVEVTRLRQHATLATRPDKTHRSLAKMTGEWRQRAAGFVGDDPMSWVETLAHRNDLPPLRRDDLADEMLAEAGQLAAQKVAERRAAFSRANILAEVHRQLHGVRFASPDERIAVAERTTDLALAATLMVSAPELHHTPGRFRRADNTRRGYGARGQRCIPLRSSSTPRPGFWMRAGRCLGRPSVGVWWLRCATPTCPASVVGCRPIRRWRSSRSPAPAGCWTCWSVRPGPARPRPWPGYERRGKPSTGVDRWSDWPLRRRLPRCSEPSSGSPPRTP
jgi:conjugative relaxase-like TrwC/TraI family protein